jgi:threonine aldolase
VRPRVGHVGPCCYAPGVTDTSIELGCGRRLSWHRPVSPADRLAAAASYAREHAIPADRYGEGSFLAAFESEIAALLGMEAGLFVGTGGAAQLIATRVWAEDRHDCRIGLHRRSHVELREGQGYQRVNRLEPVWIGDDDAPLCAASLVSLEAGSVLVEIPLRALGGALPSFEEWRRIQACAAGSPPAFRVRPAFHIDGARIWEAAAAYGCALRDVCAHADSVYVSFYKGLGSTTGAMLAGSATFIAAAREWRDRFGARMVELFPLAIPARHSFELRRHRFPGYHARAQALAEALRSIEGIRVFPDPPHTNMFHVYFGAEPGALSDARDRIAAERGIWLFGFFAKGLDIGTCYGEVVIGDAADDLTDAEVTSAMAELVERAMPRAT